MIQTGYPSFGWGWSAWSWTTIKLTWQTISSDAIALGVCSVAYNTLTNEWTKQTNVTSTSIGFYTWTAWEIILSWSATTTWLSPGNFYYTDLTTGALTTTKTVVKVWFAKSTTEMIVDIDVESSSTSNTNIPSPAGSAGYVIGWAISWTWYSTTMSKTLFSTETNVALASNLISPVAFAVWVNSSSKWYILGWNVSATEILWIDFSNDTATNPSATVAWTWMYGNWYNSTTKWYWYASWDVSSTLKFINFSDETTWTGAALHISWSSMLNTSSANSSTKWYSFWLDTGWWSYNIVSALTFSSETSVSVWNLITWRRYSTAVNSTTSAYVAGWLNGAASSLLSSIDKYSFTSDTSASSSATLTAWKQRMCGFNSLAKGFLNGWYTNTGATAFSNTVEAISFSSDTMATISANLAVAKWSASGIQSGWIL